MQHESNRRSFTLLGVHCPTRWIAATAFGLYLSTTSLAQTVLHETIVDFQSIHGPGVFRAQVVDMISDVNNDGMADLVVGDLGAPINGQSSGAAHVVSGMDGSILFSFFGDQRDDRLGANVAGVGDINNDGTEDVAVTMLIESIGGANLALGAVRVFSGSDGALLHEFAGLEYRRRINIDGAGDVNGDGFDDVLVGIPQLSYGSILYPAPVDQGWVFVFSGLDGSTLYRMPGTLHAPVDPDSAQFGSSVAGLGDVDSDGFDDFAASTLDSFLVFSGVDASLIHVFPAHSSEFFGRAKIAAAGDVDADGRTDFVLGVPRGSADGFQGYADVLSGLDGSLLWRAYGLTASSGFGNVLGSAGDLNQDGHDDVFIAEELSAANGYWSGAVRVFSGLTGNVLVEILGEHPLQRFGSAIRSLGDTNSDGMIDFAIAQIPSQQDQSFTVSRVFSGLALPPEYPSHCNGDGGDQLGCTPCPCNNDIPASVEGGCRTQSGGGARLFASGDASVTAASGIDTDLRFGIRFAPRHSFAILISGANLTPTNMSNPCFGSGSGIQSSRMDGLRCVTTDLRRHGSRETDNSGTIGVTSSPWGGEGNPAVGIAQQGNGFAAGQVRYFQVTMRASLNSSCGTGLNTTQAVEVTFQP